MDSESDLEDLLCDEVLESGFYSDDSDDSPMKIINEWSYETCDTFYDKVDNFAKQTLQNIDNYESFLIESTQTYSKNTIIEKLLSLKRSFNEQYKSKSKLLKKIGNSSSKRGLRPKKSQTSANDFNSQQLSQVSRSFPNLIISRSATNTMFDKQIGLIYEKKQYKVTRNSDRVPLCFLIDQVVKMLRQDTFCTTRDIYYKNMKLFKKTYKLDRLIKDLCITIGISRMEMNIIASPKGFVYGDLVFTTQQGQEVDCKNVYSAAQVPENSRMISITRSDAKFILVVEKYATFFQLITDKICDRFKLILITGCGYPDIRTRAFLQKLWLTLKLPVFALVDGDAYGVEIMCTYKYGSAALAHENLHLNVPEVRWLGIQADDIVDFRLQGTRFQPRELQRFCQLQRREYMRENEEWNNQLIKMQQLGIKVEIQALQDYSPKFLLEVYLPYKIRFGDWK